MKCLNLETNLHKSKIPAMSLIEFPFSTQKHNTCRAAYILHSKHTQKPHADNYDVTENIDTIEITGKSVAVHRQSYWISL